MAIEDAAEALLKTHTHTPTYNTHSMYAVRVVGNPCVHSDGRTVHVRPPSPCGNVRKQTNKQTQTQKWAEEWAKEWANTHTADDACVHTFTHLKTPAKREPLPPFAHFRRNGSRRTCA